MTSAHTDLPPLDPKDWESYRSLAHRMLDESLDYLRDVRERPTWTPTPADVKAAIHGEPVPREGRGETAAYEDFLRLVRPYPNGNIHPRFWGPLPRDTLSPRASSWRARASCWQSHVRPSS